MPEMAVPIGPATLAEIYGGTPDELPLDPDEWESRAAVVLEPGPFDYIAGGAGGESTMRANREAFTVTLRLSVDDSCHRHGEIRRVVHVHHEAGIHAGFPIDFPAGMVAAVHNTDLRGDGLQHDLHRLCAVLRVRIRLRSDLLAE